MNVLKNILPWIATLFVGVAEGTESCPHLDEDPAHGECMKEGFPIYLDYQAGTPCDPRVLKKMLPYFCTYFGNPHSNTHAHGWKCHDAIEDSRARIARVLNADPKELVFTSGATEANNIAIKGVAAFLKQTHPQKRHIITCAIEHKSVLDTCKDLEKEGFHVTILPIQKNGLIDLKTLESEIKPETGIVSIMTVNNEIGVIQPIKEIADLCHKKGTLFHTDAVQALGRIPINVKDIGADFMSFSGHKIYGPKGVGLLFIRNGVNEKSPILPIFSGGKQENGIRPGTTPVPLCVGFGEAAVLAESEREKEADRILALRNRLLGKLKAMIPDVRVNGDLVSRIPGNLNVSFRGIDGRDLIKNIRDRLAISAGSACSSKSNDPSPVIRALGLEPEYVKCALRFGFGRYTTQKDVDEAARLIVEQIKKLRETK